MPPRLLIINCASPYFFYIPMGTFGLCDFLGQQGIVARIFNPALYNEEEMPQRLVAALDDLAPTHVGLVLHWQETAHGLIRALQLVKAWNPAVITLAGGFTASYLAEDILATLPGLDYVVTGDPEEPVAQLLQGRSPAGIANLVRRDRDGRVRRTPDHWLITASQLDRLSFAGLDALIDADSYLDKINSKLGFPLFLGRGCVFDCQYCGGSRHAFRRHSHRPQPVTRSLAAILNDLRALKGRTRLLYLCYENDPAFVLALFRAIAADDQLRGHFTLHYGAWHLLDQSFLEGYGAAFNLAIPPIFEFSPEVCADAVRAAIKGHPTYTLAELEANINQIGRYFGGRVRIEVFFSRYHPALTAEMLTEEIGDISRFKHRVLVGQAAPVHICFDHLSTDVASRNWEQEIENPSSFTGLLRLKEGVDGGELYPFPVDNLCLFIPAHLDQGFRVEVEALALVLEQLEHHCHELFHILLARLDVDWFGLLAEILAPRLGPDNLAAFFAAPPLASLVEELGQRLAAKVSWAAALPFLADLIRFSLKKLAHGGRPPGPCSVPGGALVINPERVSIHHHDYPDLLPLLKRLQGGGDGAPAYQRTVCFFLPSGIVTLPQAAYRATFKFFEQPQTLARYQALIQGQGLNRGAHDRLLAQFIEEGLLLPATRLEGSESEGLIRKITKQVIF